MQSRVDGLDSFYSLNSSLLVYRSQLQIEETADSKKKRLLIKLKELQFLSYPG